MTCLGRSHPRLRGRDLIALRRSTHHRLGFALQMCTARHIGRFLPDDPLDAPWPVVEHLAAQLGIEETSLVKRYIERPKTAFEHAWEIRNAYECHEYGIRGGRAGSVRSCAGGRGRTPSGRRRRCRSWTKTTAAGRSAYQEPIGSIRDGQALGEQSDDVTPGSPRVPWVVADAGTHGVVDRWMVEGVKGSP